MEKIVCNAFLSRGAAVNHIPSPQLCFASEYDVQLLEVDGYLEQKLNYVVLYCK